MVEISAKGENEELRSHCPICAALPESTVDQLVQIVSRRTVPKGTRLYAQDQVSRGFFVVVQGSIRLFKTGESGKELVLAILRPGTAFGEATIYGPGVYTENAVAHEDGEVIFVPKEQFLPIVRESAELGRSLTESICRWLGAYSVLVENLNLSSARERLVRYIRRGLGPEGGHELRLGEKKHEIAMQLGIRPETFSRTLAELEQEGVIAVQGRVIRVLKEECLQ